MSAPQQIVSSLVPMLGLAYKISKTAIRESDPQSWIYLMKIKPQWIVPLWRYNKFATIASGLQAIAKRIGNTSFRVRYPHQISCQKLTLDPSPASKEMNLLKECQSFQIVFQRLTPYEVSHRIRTPTSSSTTILCLNNFLPK